MKNRFFNAAWDALIVLGIVYCVLLYVHSQLPLSAIAIRVAISATCATLVTGAFVVIRRRKTTHDFSWKALEEAAARRDQQRARIDSMIAKSREHLAYLEARKDCSTIKVNPCTLGRLWFLIWRAEHVRDSITNDLDTAERLSMKALDAAGSYRVRVFDGAPI